MRTPEHVIFGTGAIGLVVDSSKIVNKLNVHATPIEQALVNTLATYRT